VCVHVCVDKSKSGSGDMVCSVDLHTSGCEYVDTVCLFVCSAESANQQNLVATVRDVVSRLVLCHHRWFHASCISYIISFACDVVVL